jgi:hypothetical protein
MKLRITADIIDDDGNVVVKPTSAGVDIPEFEQFINGTNFLDTFDQYERPVLKARNEVLSGITEQYLEELFKKKPHLKPKNQQNGK